MRWSEWSRESIDDTVQVTWNYLVADSTENVLRPMCPSVLFLAWKYLTKPSRKEYSGNKKLASIIWWIGFFHRRGGFNLCCCTCKSRAADSTLNRTSSLLTDQFLNARAFNSLISLKTFSWTSSLCNKWIYWMTKHVKNYYFWVVQLVLRLKISAVYTVPGILNLLFR